MSGRRRAASRVQAQAQGRQQSRQTTPKSAHVSDPFLASFLDPSFDAAEYWNATLPPLQVSGSGSGGGITSTRGASAITGSSSSKAAPLPLADLSAHAQTTISQLNAHTTRLSNTLTQLTDDILRSGSRLAYEVELLRGETLSFAEALTDGLAADINKFVPGGLARTGPLLTSRRHSLTAAGGETEQQQQHEALPSTAASQRRGSLLGTPAAAATAETTSTEDPNSTSTSKEAATTTSTTTSAAAAGDDQQLQQQQQQQPPYIGQLRTLTLVRSRLESVIQTFGEAIDFAFPPSELTLSSGFLSVSAPEPAGSDAHTTEEKGQQVLRRLRDEVTGYLHPGRVDPVRGIEEAARRVETLKALSVVWRGTAEEKGRARFIESLARLVEDRHRDLLRELDAQAARPTRRLQQQDQQDAGSRRAAAGGGGGDADGGGGGGDGGKEASSGGGGYGLISQLQKLRGGL